MHLNIITRGERICTQRMMEQLSSNFFPWKKGGKIDHVQLSVRPVQMWELVFPKESMDVVLRSLWTEEQFKDFPGRFKTQLNLTRRAMKLKKIDPPVFPGPMRIISNDFVATYPVGMKEDGYDEERQCEDL